MEVKKYVPVEGPGSYVENLCSQKVWHKIGTWGSNERCRNQAVVVVDGVKYCGTHNPIKKKARDDEKEVQRKFEMKRKQDIRKGAEKLIAELGYGHPEFYNDRRGWGYTGNVVLEPKEVQSLLAVLGAGPARRK